jgi:hypothetical protein
MRQHKLLFIIFCHTSLALLEYPYPKQTFELPTHPLNWICTVRTTVATYGNATTSDITEHSLTSNREKIIPTLSTMLNRTISRVPSHVSLKILMSYQRDKANQLPGWFKIGKQTTVLGLCQTNYSFWWEERINQN